MLEFKNSSLSTAGQLVVDNLSLKLEDGENLCITGRQGTGKTTLLLAMQGLLPFDKGYFTIEGEVVNKASAAYFRKRMCYLPQSLELPYETVEDWIDGILDLKINQRKDISKKMIIAELQQSGLEESICKAAPSSLDKGSLQCIMLAMEGLLKRPILLLDDLQMGREIEYIRRLNHDGVSAIVVLQDESLVRIFDKHISLDKESV